LERITEKFEENGEEYYFLKKWIYLIELNRNKFY
jgi:hypothetical protein